MFKFGMRRRKKTDSRVNQCESPFKYTLTHIARVRVRILKSNRKGSKLNVYFKFLIFFLPFREHFSKQKYARVYADSSHSILTSDLNSIICHHLPHRSSRELPRFVCGFPETKHEKCIEPFDRQYGNC